MNWTLIGLDCGNAYIKITDGQANETFPHALKRLMDYEVDEYRARNELSENPDLFCVNGEYFLIGEKAIRRGAGEVLYGENRYTREYYGVLVAIALFRLLPDSRDNIFLIGEHTPKDVIYRQELTAAALGDWKISSLGLAKKFTVKKVKGYDEPIGVFRYATLNDKGGAQSGWLRQGRCLVIDLGGLTTGFGVVNNGYVDYDNSSSLELGMLDLESQLEKTLRKNNKNLLRGAQWLEPLGLRAALANPGRGYDARGAGFIPCTEEVDEIFNGYTRRLTAHFQSLGGITHFDTILLGGGGTGTAERRIRKALNHPHTYVADSDLNEIHLASCLGAWRAAHIVIEAGKLS